MVKRSRQNPAKIILIEPVRGRPVSKIESIEHEVERLDDKAFAAFREWFMAHENARWDRQIQADSKNGKLDSLIQEAATAHRSGQSTAL